jgi:hypothetical protein
MESIRLKVEEEGSIWMIASPEREGEGGKQLLEK